MAYWFYDTVFRFKFMNDLDFTDCLDLLAFPIGIVNLSKSATIYFVSNKETVRHSGRCCYI